MKLKRLWIVTLILVFLLNINYTGYAFQNKNPGKYAKRVIILLKERLHISESEIEQARLEGKTAFDIAKSKGMGESELRQCITAEATSAIDSLSSKGILPNFITNIIKSLAVSKIQAWDGSLD